MTNVIFHLKGTEGEKGSTGKKGQKGGKAEVRKINFGKNVSEVARWWNATLLIGKF